MATRPAYVPGTIGHARNPSTESDLSTSSNEDKPEETSRQILSGILENIVSFPDYQPMPTRELRYSLEVSMKSEPMTIHLGTKSKVTARNDGGLYLTRQGEYTGSNRYGKVPLLSFEAKRRHAGNIRRPGGEEERYSPDVLAQEIAELLGQVMEHNAQVGKVKDQEAFVLSIHGTHLKLTAAHFTAEYLSHIRSPTMPESEKLLVRRSKPFDLKTKLGRAGALQLCIGIFEYFWSGKAEIALLQKIFE